MRGSCCIFRHVYYPRVIRKYIEGDAFQRKAFSNTRNVKNHQLQVNAFHI